MYNNFLGVYTHTPHSGTLVKADSTFYPTSVTFSATIYHMLCMRAFLFPLHLQKMTPEKESFFIVANIYAKSDILAADL